MKKTIFYLFVIFVISCSNSKRSKVIIISEKAPEAIGPYSQAVKVGDFLYVSGQLGIEPGSGKLKESFEEQTVQALENIKNILKNASCKMSDVVQCQVFLKNLDNYAKFNSIYLKYFTEDYPARAVVEVSRLPASGLVEIMVVAIKPN